MIIHNWQSRWLALLLILVSTALLGVACAPIAPATQKEIIKETVIVEKPVEVVVVATPAPAAVEKQLTIYHWWTFGGEREAMNKIFEWYNKKNSDIEIVDNPIAGGGGITLKTVLLGLLAAKIPPDTFQSLSGAELKQYVGGR
jgi:glucose/mannose transport system substrate-binding protein